MNSIKAEAATRKTRRELLKEIDPEYYGYLDDDEYLLLDEEEKHEREGILSFFIIPIYKRIEIMYIIDLKLDKKRSNFSMRIRWIQISKKRRRQRVTILNPMAKYVYE